MKKRLFSLFSVLVILHLTACSKPQNERAASRSDDYYEGRDKGYHSAMMDLWFASGDLAFLAPGDIWDTSDFTLKMNGSEEANESNRGRMSGDVCFYLTVKDSTLDESFLDPGKVLFYVFADDTSRIIFSGDGFYEFAIFETPFEDTQDYRNSHYAQASIELYDEEDSVALLIAVNGNLYRAWYSAA